MPLNSFSNSRFTHYEPYEPLKNMDVSDIDDFMGDYFPSKAMWACPTNVNAYIATFKKFFKWQITNDTRDTSDYAELLATIRENKEVWMESVCEDDEDTYDW